MNDSEYLKAALEHAGIWAQWVSGLSTGGLAALWVLRSLKTHAPRLIFLSVAFYSISLVSAVSMVGSIPYMFSKAASRPCYADSIPWRLRLIDCIPVFDFGNVGTIMHVAWLLGSGALVFVVLTHSRNLPR